MNIEAAILIDGEAVKANSDLQNMINSLVANYIKQKFFGNKQEKKVRAPRDPNAPKREKRPHLTLNEKEQLDDMARKLSPTHSMSGTAREISKVLDRPINTIMSYLFRMKVRDGLSFASYDHKNQTIISNS